MEHNLGLRALAGLVEPESLDCPLRSSDLFSACVVAQGDIDLEGAVSEAEDGGCCSFAAAFVWGEVPRVDMASSRRKAVEFGARPFPYDDQDSASGELREGGRGGTVAVRSFLMRTCAHERGGDSARRIVVCRQSHGCTRWQSDPGLPFAA